MQMFHWSKMYSVKKNMISTPERRVYIQKFAKICPLAKRRKSETFWGKWIHPIIEIIISSWILKLPNIEILFLVSDTMIELQKKLYHTNMLFLFFQMLKLHWKTFNFVSINKIFLDLNRIQKQWKNMPFQFPRIKFQRVQNILVNFHSFPLKFYSTMFNHCFIENWMETETVYIPAFH